MTWTRLASRTGIDPNSTVPVYFDFPSVTYRYFKVQWDGSSQPNYGGAREFFVGTASLPTLSTLSPNSGPAGTQVTVTGAGYGATQNNGNVAFNGVAATIVSWSDTQVVVTVPNTLSGPVVVTSSSGLQTNSSLFAATLNGYIYLPKAGWTAHAISTCGGSPNSLLDATDLTAHDGGWWTDCADPFPSWVYVDMGSAQTINFIRVDPRTDCACGRMTSGGVFGSNDASTWTLLASLAGIDPNSTAPVYFQFTAVSYRYFKVQWNGSGQPSYAGAAELFAGVFVPTGTHPVVTSVTPNVGPWGTQATVVGTGFGASQGGSTIAFDGVTATPLSWSDTQISANVPTGASSGPIAVIVNAANSNADVSFTVVPLPLAVATSSLPSGIQNTGYSATLTATGGVTPYTWSIASGSLPLGLSLNASTGAITGTPTTAATSNFTVQVSDAGSSTATAPLSITVYGFSLLRALVIDHSKVANTDQTDFPVLISGTYPFLATTANGGSVQNSNGYDIIFTSDSTGQLRLDHEIESYDPVTGAINFWIRVPLLSHTSDTTIYVRGGNAGITSTQENKAGVWRNGYVQIWHKGGLETTDSLGMTGTPTGITAVAGEINLAGNYNGSASNLLPGTNLGSVPVTVSAWVKRGSTIGDQLVYTDWWSYNDGYSAGNWGFDLRLLGSNNKLRWIVGTGYCGSCSASIVSTNAVTDTSSFHYVVGLNNRTQNKLYIDGTPAAAAVNSGGVSYGQTYQGSLINKIGPSFNGVIDEVRVSNVERSADWIATEYNNQSSASTFYIVGLLLTTTSLPIATQNVAYNASLSAVGGVAPYTWSIASGAMPAGLTLNASSGTITGTPTASGSVNVTLQVTDSGMPPISATRPLTLNVNPPLVITTAGLASAIQNVVYNATLAATGGVTPYAWSISAGSLPPGLSLGTSTGAITGIPTTIGTSSFTAQVTEANGSIATKALNITINGSLSVTTSSLPKGAQNTPYSATLAATGGATPYSWSIVSGSLPPGLSLNSGTGAITGTPTTLVTSNFTVQVSDASSNIATAPLSITINFSDGYAVGRAVVINHSKVPNTDQTDFPVLIAGTYPFLATAANGGSAQSNNGYDIIFTSDSAGQVKLDHEIESYDPVTGTVNFWVRVPLLSHTSDTTIYLWTGNSGITTSQENKSGVWSNGYIQVWHKGGFEATDSLGVTGTPTAITAVNGEIDQAGSYGGSSSNVLSGTVLPGGTPVTVSAWLKRASVTGDQVIYTDWYYFTDGYSSSYDGFDLRFLTVRGVIS